MKKSLLLSAVIVLTIGTVTAFAMDKKNDKKAAGADSAAAPAATATTAEAADSTVQKKDSAVCPRCGRKTQKKFYFEATPGDKVYCCSSFCADVLRKENDKSKKKSTAGNTNSTAAKNTDKKKTKTTQ